MKLKEALPVDPKIGQPHQEPEHITKLTIGLLLGHIRSNLAYLSDDPTVKNNPKLKNVLKAIDEIINSIKEDLPPEQKNRI